jgi:hypothetical protein
MGQVPDSKIGIVGSGRAAKHFIYYLSLLEIPFTQWSRGKFQGNLKIIPQIKSEVKEELQVEEVLRDCETIVVLISDSEIENFITSTPWENTHRFVHFSGSLVSELAVGFHPLMTFGDHLYDIELYKNILFVGEKGAPFLNEIFPKLSNPFTQILKELKPRYHALCVSAGNFTTILWQKFFGDFEKLFSIAPENAFPYLERITENLKTNWKTALTGPLARRDFITIEKNLASLSGDSFEALYKSFLSFYFLEDSDFRGKFL